LALSLKDRKNSEAGTPLQATAVDAANNGRTSSTITVTSQSSRFESAIFGGARARVERGVLGRALRRKNGSDVAPQCVAGEPNIGQAGVELLA
jgi:hypothetical protein